MDDRSKTCLSLLFFSSTLILPLVALAAGWIAVDFQTGATVALITFAFFFLLSGIFLSLVRFPSWFTVSLPFLFGFLYAIIPDFVPGPFDDAAAVVAGAVLSFVLWLKKQPDVPKWVILPLASVGVYVLVGGLIPGPIDELLVAAVAAAVSIYGANRLPEQTIGQEDLSAKDLDHDTGEEVIAIGPKVIETIEGQLDEGRIFDEEPIGDNQSILPEDVIMLGEPNQIIGETPDRL